jgi:hypothetical protein
MYRLCAAEQVLTLCALQTCDHLVVVIGERPRAEVNEEPDVFCKPYAQEVEWALRDIVYVTKHQRVELV